MYFKLLKGHISNFTIHLVSTQSNCFEIYLDMELCLWWPAP